MYQDISKQKIFQKLFELNLPPEDFAVFGSAPMWLHGLKDLKHDVDIIARGKAWDKSLTYATAKPAKATGNVISLFEDKIEIFDIWYPGEWDTDNLIDTAITVQGIKFVTLENVVKWKQIFNREKDQKDILTIQNFINEKQKYI